MPCSVCGEICRCSLDSDSTASTFALSAPELQANEAASAQEPESVSPSIASSDNTAPPTTDPVVDDSAWRQEVAARLNRYQARRKPRPPRYPSLRLHFNPHSRAVGDPFDVPALPSVSNHAVVFDGVSADSEAVSSSRNEFPDQLMEASEPGSTSASTAYSAHSEAANPSSVAPARAKIIEFPRFWVPAPPPADELAEPVASRPRILEAPDVAPPPPALGGITIEPAKQPEREKLPGIDIPLQTAPLGRRVAAAAIDDTLIATACALFALVFWKLTAIQPARLQIVAVLASLAALFWAAYQYLLIMYTGSTPGLRLAGLELSRFDGGRVSRKLRRWRVLASFLSAVSLGMGYGWVLLDEDSLCWHDRITRTYLARVKSPPAVRPASTPKVAPKSGENPRPA
jgi:uncharacterized RDD family membrane protein YckC